MSSEGIEEVEVSTTPRWEKSPSPPDPWGDIDSFGDGSGNWQFDIIGEEVDYDGTVLHEVRWDEWHRADGTKATWEPVDSTSIDSSKYRLRQKKRRRSLVNDSLQIDVYTTTDIHNTETFLRGQAYDEKLQRAKKVPQPNHIAEMAALMAKHQEHIRPGHGASSLSSQLSVANQVRRSMRQLTETSLASSSTALGRAASRAVSSSSSVTLNSAPIKSSQPPPLNQDSSPQTSKATASEPPPGLSAKAKGKLREVDVGVHPPPSDYSFSPRKRVKRVVRSASSDELSIVSSSQHVSSSHSIGAPQPAALQPRESAEAKRQRLQNEWTRVAQKKGAAPITFVNDVDDEATPPIDKHFVYLECDYKFAPGIEQPDSGFLTSCDCHTCGPLPVDCGCQDDWAEPNFAYTPSGLFAFNVKKNVEVIECNKGCACSVETCVNSVSQRSRKIPIEVFKTKARGWGVRSPVAIPRGKVLGLYTGLLIRRDVSLSLPGSLGVYCFDLDGDEIVPTGSQPSQSGQSSQSTTAGKYSVDSRLEGNWTRFINHSCAPNLEIYLVVHDRPAGCGMPYIVFVANKLIPPETEFSFDYDPAAAAKLAHEKYLNPSKFKGKSKEKPSIPEDAVKCLCGSRGCRGYFRGI